MKQTFGLLLFCLFILSCETQTASEKKGTSLIPIEGTWALLSGTTIVKNDTSVIDYTKNLQMIKIINATHFSFLKHEMNKGKDSAMYGSGGGWYTLQDSLYTEHLDYCSDRAWEGQSFAFTVSIQNDTLIQSGKEKLENLGIDRIIIEKYVRIKK